MEDENINKAVLSVQEAVNSYSKTLASLFPVGTALGGAIFIFYFLQINYIPPIGVAELALLFTASAIVGMLIFISIGFLPAIASLPWQLALEQKEVAQKFECNDWRERFRAFIVWCSLPVIATVVFAYLVYSFKKYLYLLLVAAAILISIYVAALIKIKLLSLKQSFCFLVATIASAFFMTFALSIWGLIAFKKMEHENAIDQWLVLIFITFVVTAVTTLTIKPYAGFGANLPEGVRTNISRFVISISGVVILFSAIGYSSFTNAVANSLGVGGYRIVDIILDKNGKTTMSLLGIDCSNTTENDYCVVNGLKVLWGRGDEYLFRYTSDRELPVKTQEGKSENIDEFNFTLPRSSVLSVVNMNN